MSDQKSASPFAALTFAEQQDRWREWRSRELKYASAEELPPVELPAPPEKPAPAPTARINPPFIPARHAQLNSLAAKHKQALSRAAVWQATSARE